MEARYSDWTLIAGCDNQGKDRKPGTHQPSKAKDRETSNAGDQLNDKITATGLKVRNLKSNKAEKAAVGKDRKPDAHQPSKAKEPIPPRTSNPGDRLNNEITAEGLKVRDLKYNKAEKTDITAAEAILLDLKARYKAAVGKDWKPNAHQPSKAKEPSPLKETSNAGDQLNDKITATGLKVRNLKSNKAEKAAVGKDWKPDAHQPSKAREPTPPRTSKPGDRLNNKINAQGLKVRNLKSNKAEKADVTAAVAILLDLKARYMAAVGKDWKPNAHQSSKAKEHSPGDQLNDEITAKCPKVNDLKSNKAENADITAAVGKDWKPNAPQPSKAKEPSLLKETSKAGDQLNDKITAKCLKVRDLKSNKAEKADITAAVAIPLDLKAKYKATVGKDWKPNAQKTSANQPSERVMNEWRKLENLHFELFWLNRVFPFVFFITIFYKFKVYSLKHR